MWNLNIYDVQMPDSSMRGDQPWSLVLPHSLPDSTLDFGGGGSLGQKTEAEVPYLNSSCALESSPM